VISTPSVAATWQSWLKVAWGLASQPKMRVWHRVDPVNFRTRVMQPLWRPAASAVVVKTVLMARETSATLSIGEAPGG
jgi:hypothetical protein